MYLLLYVLTKRVSAQKSPQVIKTLDKIDAKDTFRLSILKHLIIF